ncbi:type II secretion system protein [Ornithinibacillus halophilus]|uniref:Prepilin-type N-terminal cleavage/methylation domain-containing protein n=1 Tax=Ornithinibacillus halophilus TaxID=930117 RepID=A0A1M5GHF8_9BACI|nr:type II secretion system protein [Ornithinibacillus halophilus]SHG03157.1 prepilin-type N-terminal cleavage/methylation domain-containing protein [Ornithinibacillus halophilus]
MKEKHGMDGYTMVELLTVLVILSIITLIAILSVSDIIDNTKKDVCIANLSELERSYEMHLHFEGVDHEEFLFRDFFGEFTEDICPEHGVISYDGGDVLCSIHSDVEHDDSEDNDEVPFL